MKTNQQEAQELLFGADGIAASNFKLFPGSTRDLTPEQVSSEIVASLTRVMTGQAEEVEF